MSDERKAIDECRSEHPAVIRSNRADAVCDAMLHGVGYYYWPHHTSVEVNPRNLAEPATDPYELEHD